MTIKSISAIQFFASFSSSASSPAADDIIEHRSYCGKRKWSPQLEFRLRTGACDIARTAARTMQCNHVTLRSAFPFLAVIKSNCLQSIVKYCKSDVSNLRTKGTAAVCSRWKVKSMTVSAQQFSGQFLSPYVFSPYYTPSSKSRRFLTFMNTFLRLRHKKAWEEKISNLSE